MTAGDETNEPVDILLVDDRIEDLTAMKSILVRDDYNIVTASSGPEALRLLLDRDFAVILLDVRMPTMDGYELARRLKTQGCQARLIALTGYGQPEDRRRSMEAGFDAHLVKPIDLERLLRALARTTSPPS